MGKVGSRGPGGGDVVPFPGGREQRAAPPAPRPQKPLRDMLLRIPAERLEQEPPPREWLLTSAQTGQGVIPMGRVGLLAARGGAGKSFLVTQLSVAVASGTVWLGAGRGWTARRGRALLVLAEEDDDETLRRLYWSCRAAGLGPSERAQVVANVDVVPAAGQGVALTRELDGVLDELPETARAEELRAILRAAKSEGRPYVSVVLDPLSRLAGADVEADPAAATRWIQVAETFTAPDCGAPAVFVAHHARKGTAKDGVDVGDPVDAVRGSSALRDGARWVLLLERLKAFEGAPEMLRFGLAKKNYAGKAELLLVQPEEDHGCLRAATPEEETAYKDARDAARRKPERERKPKETPREKLQRRCTAVLELLAERGMTSRNMLADLLDIRRPEMGTVIEELERSRRIVRQGGQQGGYTLIEKQEEAADGDPQNELL